MRTPIGVVFRALRKAMIEYDSKHGTSYAESIRSMSERDMHVIFGIAQALIDADGIKVIQEGGTHEHGLSRHLGRR